MKREFVLLLGLLMMSFALAEISISEPNDVYNLGDRLYVSLEGLVGASSGNLNIDLVCGGVATNLVKISARAFSGEGAQSYSVPYKILDREDLEIENLTDIIGDCQVVAGLGSQVSSSKSFVVSDSVTVGFSLDKAIYNPGEEMIFNVDATKVNGVKLNGFVSVVGIVGFEKAVEEGLAENVLTLPGDVEAGRYELNVSVYDVGADGSLNRGYQLYSFEIAQVASSVTVSLSGEDATPGVDFGIGAEVFDQSGIKMDGTVLLEISSGDANKIVADLSAGDFGNIVFPLNSSVGTWTVKAKFDEMESVRTFEMLPLQKVEFDLEDAILTVRNIGNVLYNKTINVEIGEDVLAVDLEIEVGQVKQFDLGAPNGEYEVVIGDGDSVLSKNVRLTGNAVSVEDLKNFGVFKNYSLIWIFLIVVLALVGLLLFVRYRKTKTLGKRGFVGKMKDRIVKKVPGKVKSHVDQSLNFTNKSPAVNGLDAKNHVAEDKTMVDLTKKAGATAESSLVLKGEKLVSGIVSLSLKNYGGLGDDTRSNLQGIVMGAKGKGLVDWRGDYVFIVFSPLVTRTYGNESLAVHAGMEIVEKLNAYNKKFKEKVEFGLGVHVGELVASKVGDKLKYTSIGNTISFAKRMSDSDPGKVVVSEEIKKKLLRDLKVTKGKDIGEKLTYVVSEVKDGAANAEKLKQLLKRTGK
ncbi:hypothetical protein HNV12_02025 [Methanococcoides sp. SA1]|nr:hypothetical protein [Methanococcoides sp. SA1]